MTDEIKAKREQLKAMSKAAKMLVSTGAVDSINEALVEMYRNEGHEEIHSFRKWRELGFTVNKGEKALLLWGQPRQAHNQEKKQDNENDEFKFWPLAYVFSNKQVRRLHETAEAR
jgi:hypothetical protein